MKIGIIGASSQIGTSLTMYFKLQKNIEPLCFIRSGYSKPFFEILNVPVTELDFDIMTKYQNQINELDVIVDCSYPAEQFFSILPSLEKKFESIISQMKTGSTYINMSSFMAFGMPPNNKYVEQYKIPQTSYALIKRKSEKIVEKIAKKYQVNGYNFRLGQVHGFLQSVHNAFRTQLSKESVLFVDGDKKELTNTIFINAIAEAIINCYKKAHAPGVYTLVSNPQWTLEELFNYYKTTVEESAETVFEPIQDSNKKNSLKKLLYSKLKGYKHLLETYVLLNNPNTAIKIKGRYRIVEAKASIISNHKKVYASHNVLGKPPMQTIANIQSSFEEVKQAELMMQETYFKLLEAQTK